jgi:putative membrane protein
MRQLIINGIKGGLMGAANIIPGVSGGTIALLTGIFEKLINSLKACDITAIKLIFSGKWKQFAEHINLSFLLAVFGGALISILSLARALEYLFEKHEIYVWAFFFGLILASVWFIGNSIKKYSLSVVINFIVGTVIALIIANLKPASENDAMFYLMICGVVATCSMILPGLSGSFVLVLMGNYQLVMIDAVAHFRFEILAPVIIGAIAGLLTFSHFLSWVFKKYHNQTIALLTGFILGSLQILWPWKDPIIQIFGKKEKVIGYNYSLPNLSVETGMAVLLIFIGIFLIWMIERR